MPLVRRLWFASWSYAPAMNAQDISLLGEVLGQLKRSHITVAGCFTTESWLQVVSNKLPSAGGFHNGYSVLQLYNVCLTGTV